MIELHFLGRGAAFYPRFGNTNAYFTLGRDLFFLDFGESAFEKAVCKLDLGAYEHIYVLLTHLHADHAGSLASLCSYTHCVLKREICIVHPQSSVAELLRLQGIAPQFYHYAPALPPGCPLQAEAVEVRHAADMRCYGWLLSADGETIYFSGDSSDISSRVLKGLRDGGISRVYHDTAMHVSESHCHISALEEKIPLEERGRVWCMHLDSDCEQELLAKGFRVVTCDQ